MTRLARTYALDLLIVAAGVGAYIELEAQRDNYGDFLEHPPLGTPHWQIALAAVGMSLPLLARRRFAFAASTLSLSVAVLVSFIDGRIVPNSGFLFLLGFAVSFLYGFVEDNREAVAGLAVSLAAVTLLIANDPGSGAGDFAFVWLMFALAWLAGFSLRRRMRMASDLEVRAERAVADERARIARELHDVVAHAVSVMTVQAGAVRRLLRDDQQREREALETVEKTGRQALAEMRRMVGVLRNPEDAPALAPQPSLEYLERLVEQVRAAGLDVDVRIEGERTPLPAGLDLTAYRLVQEALTNTLRHAQATHAEVVVRYGAGEVELVIADDGRGAESEEEGHGLVGLRERVAVYGGELHAGPRRGGGYELRAKLPVEAA